MVDYPRGPIPEARQWCSGMVEKAVELAGTGGSVEDAVEEALDRARLTLEGITRFEIVRVTGTVDGSRPAYQVEIRLWFTLLERMHG